MFELVEFCSDRARIDVSRDSALVRCCIQSVSNHEMSRIVQYKHFPVCLVVFTVFKHVFSIKVQELC
jgi:hypothetical protein